MFLIPIWGQLQRNLGNTSTMITFFRVLIGLPVVLIGAPVVCVVLVLWKAFKTIRDIAANLIIVSYDFSAPFFETKKPENLVEKLRRYYSLNGLLWDHFC